MKHALALLVFCGVTAFEAIHAQTPEFVQDPWEVRLPHAAISADAESQRTMRQQPFWVNSEPASSGWLVVMHEDRESPARMWGPGQPFSQPDMESRALAAWSWSLSTLGWSPEALGEMSVARGAKHQRVFAQQVLAGLPV